MINLVIALLVATRYLSREEIRDLVAGYSDATSEASFARMFERDKEELRTLGVEILTGPVDPYTDDKDGYRILADDFYLPEIQLTAAESTLIGLASSVWDESVLADEVSRATAKLRASGAEISGSGFSFLAPRLAAREAGFGVVWDALLARSVVRFTYHGRRREVQPWKMISRSGAWYVLGLDETVDSPRVFRLSRIEDQPVRVGSPGAYDLPPAEQIAELASALEPDLSTGSVRVAIRDAAAGSLRRRGTPVDGDAPDGFELFDVAYQRPDEIVSAICAAGPDAVVVSPGDIRDQVIAHLRAMVEVGR